MNRACKWHCVEFVRMVMDHQPDGKNVEASIWDVAEARGKTKDEAFSTLVALLGDRVLSIDSGAHKLLVSDN